MSYFRRLNVCNSCLFHGRKYYRNPNLRRPFELCSINIQQSKFISSTSSLAIHGRSRQEKNIASESCGVRAKNEVLKKRTEQNQKLFEEKVTKASEDRLEDKTGSSQPPPDKVDALALLFGVSVAIFLAASFFFVNRSNSMTPNQDVFGNFNGESGSDKRKRRRDAYQSDEITWADFISKILPSGKVHSAHFYPRLGVLTIQVEHGATDAHGTKFGGKSEIYKINVPDSRTFENEIRRAESQAGIPPSGWISIIHTQDGNRRFGLLILLCALIGTAVYLVRKKIPKGEFNMFNLMADSLKYRIRIFDPKNKKDVLKIKFKDIAGLHEAKGEISEFVDYLRNSKKYTKLGARLPKGALMTGPPGCGKTLLAKALAAESSVLFISINGTEFIEMIGGLGAHRIRKLFKIARSRAPCIIYIDELDAIGGKRSDGKHSFGGEISEQEHTLNQLLVELDGIDSTQGVIMIGSTNRLDMLDKALLRPGRFDRHISVDLPTLIERRELFELYLRRVKKENRLLGFSQRLAQMTTGFSGADINNVVNEAAIHAATIQKKMIDIEDMDYALNKIIGGVEKKSKTLAAEERQTVAVHEAGHALVGWLLEHTDALLKVTIIPRTSAALGFAQYTSRDRYLFSREELFDRICMMLGGRVAENIVFGRITTGAQNDLEKVRKQAYAMTRIYGMNEEIGPLSFAPEPGTDQRSAEFQTKPYSKHLSAHIDNEVRKLVQEAHNRTEQLIAKNREKLDVIVKALLGREVLNYEDVKKLIGPPAFGEKHCIDLSELFQDPPVAHQQE